MFWLVYRKQDFNTIWDTLCNDVDYKWVIISMLLGVLSHICRSQRWLIALEPLGEKPKKSNTFMTVLIGYFMNLLLPRMGELARCVVLSKYEKIPTAKLLGTVVSERIIDVIVLGVITVFVVIADFGHFMEFGNNNPEVVENIKSIITSPLLWIVAVLAIVGFVFYIKWSAKKGRSNKIIDLLKGFADGIKSILAMKRYKAYIGYSFCIWILYYLMFYLIFFCFDFTKNLGPLAGLTTFVLSSFAMLAPVQGGIGAWHFMAEQGLSLYGIGSTEAKTFALLAHANSQVVVILLGAISLILIPILNRNYKPKSSSEQETETENVK